MSEMVWAEVEAGRVVGAKAAAETTKPAPLVPAEMMDLPSEGMSEMIWAEAEARRVAGAAVSLVGEGRGDELTYCGDASLLGPEYSSRTFPFLRGQTTSNNFSVLGE
jgi:hypothetical protein